MISFIIFIICAILTMKYKESFISLITGTIATFTLIYMVFVLFRSLKQAYKTDKTEISETKSKKVPPKKLSKYELELFAKQCNTALEYEDKKERWNSESDGTLH